VLLTFPLARAFVSLVGAILSGFVVSRETILLQLAAALVVGIVAALLPAWRAARIRIVEGLRAIG
jgi:putative ABC transport system permease protein